MANSTRVIFFAASADLQAVVQHVQVLSPMMDDLIPPVEEAVDQSALEDPPTKWDEDAKHRNEAALGMLKFATLGPDGVKLTLTRTRTRTRTLTPTLMSTPRSSWKHELNHDSMNDFAASVAGPERGPVIAHSDR